MTALIERDGLQIGYREAGEGPPVVLLHGAGLTHRMWDPQIEHLSPSFRCIALDLRGHGATRATPSPETYTSELHARDVIAALDALGIARAHLVGLSLGGMVAMHAALDHPSRVASVATIGSPAAIATGVVVRALLAATTRYMDRRLASDGIGWVARKGARRMTKDAEVRTYMVEDCSSNDAEEFKRVWRGVLAFDLRPRLPSLAAPTLVIAGSKDPNLRGARAAARSIPGARLELIEGAGHITNRERPDEVDALLATWLKENEI